MEWRKRNYSEKNKIEADKIKNERISIKKFLNEMNEKDLVQKKQIHDNVKINKMRLEEKKNNEKIMKNLILKSELKKQIEKEIEKIGKLNSFTKNDDEINKILKIYPNINKSNKNTKNV